MATWSSHGLRSLTDQQWNALRRAALKRDNNLCRIMLAPCTGRATEVDHILPVGERPELQAELSNLQSACAACHRIKTEQEKRRGIARAAARAYMPRESHPGLI